MRGFCEAICTVAVAFGLGLLLALFFPPRLVLILAAVLLIAVGSVVLKH